MKSITITLCVLLIAFFGVWTIKTKMPVERPDNLETEGVMAWYMSDYSSPTVDDEWMLDPTIPDNYVPVPGEDELYMVVDTSGQITGYKHRYPLEDGTWAWEDANPDIPDNYELIAGSENLYKVTDTDGNISYCLYVRNEDNTYAFVPCDEFGTPYYDGEDADVIATNYQHEDGNIYSVYNKDGVKIGNAERVKNDDGSFTWKNSDGTSNTTTAEEPNNSKDNKITMKSDNDKDENSNTKTNKDGSYVKTTKSTSTETKDGYKITYETTVTNTYDKNGNLIFSQTDGPNEISRQAIGASSTPDLTLIQDTLDGEYQRVSSLVSYNTSLANEVLTLLNAERVNQGKGTLTMDTNSEAYKLACIRAGDMATYDYSSSTSPMYGTLDDMVAKWGCTTANASENVWKAGNKSAENIHARFQAYDGSREVRMADEYTEVGIAIVSKDGQLYIAEVYLK